MVGDHWLGHLLLEGVVRGVHGEGGVDGDGVGVLLLLHVVCDGVGMVEDDGLGRVR